MIGVERRHDDGVGERKDGEQPAAAEHQPGLVAVPDGRDRVHHDVAFGSRPCAIGKRMPTPRSKPSSIT
jgi:hypothetical protein